jgi:alkanesulfonate monooxygenase SsuD/methylene tetrahydromethanopterin reductase-like flavin-dependent oxidoreductase (luciferase family)
VTVDGRWHRTRDAVLLPAPRRRPELMVGSTGPRVLAATLPHVDAWNTWYDWFGNTAEGFAAKREAIDEACRRARREPASVARSACVLVRFDGAGERPVEDGVRPLEGSDEAIGDGLRAFVDAGADEVIAVCDPITEDTIRRFGAIVAGLGLDR